MTEDWLRVSGHEKGVVEFVSVVFKKPTVSLKDVVRLLVLFDGSISVLFNIGVVLFELSVLL